MDKTKHDDLCYDIGHDIQSLLQMILGEKFNIWSTGTINPDFYEGHKNMGVMAGLQLTIHLKDFDPYPTYKQMTDKYRGN